MLLARLLGPEGVGLWALILAITGLMYSFLFGWTLQAGIRFGTEEWFLSRKTSITWSNRWPFLLTGFTIAVFLLMVQPFSFIERYFSLETHWWPLLLFFLVGKCLLSEVQGLYRITQKIAHFGFVSIIIDLVTSLFLLCLCLFKPESMFLIAAFGMTTILTTVSGMLWLYEFNNTRGGGGKTTISGMRRIFHYGLPLFPGLGLAYLSTWVPVLILDYFHSTSDVGLFNVSNQVMGALTGLAAPMSVLFLPQLIRKKIVDNYTEFDYLHRTCPTVITIWLFAIIPILVFIPLLFQIFYGDSFNDAMPILLILCAAVPGSVFTALYATLFEIQGRMGRSSLFTGIMLLVNVLTVFILVKQFAGESLAFGTFLSLFTVQLIYLWDQHRHLNVNWHKAFPLFVFSTIYGVFQFLLGSGLINRLAGACIGLLCLVALVRRLRIIDQFVFEESYWRKYPHLKRIFSRALIRDFIR